MSITATIENRIEERINPCAVFADFVSNSPLVKTTALPEIFILNKYIQYSDRITTKNINQKHNKIFSYFSCKTLNPRTL